MRAYFEIIKITLKNSIAYKLDTIINVFGSVVILYIQIFLWKALYHRNSIEILSINEMIQYQIVGIVLSLLYINSVASEVGSKVADGSISLELIRPYNFAVSMFSRTLGNIISGFLIKVIPVIVVVILAFNFTFKISIINSLILFVAVLLNIFIYWLMHYIIGLLHFVLISAGWFIRILRDTIKILGGGIIPLWFFPDVLRKISLFLPFQLLYQFPQSLYINKISMNELIFNLAAEFIWIIILSMISLYLWNLGVKRLVIQGG